MSGREKGAAHTYAYMDSDYGILNEPGLKVCGNVHNIGI